QPCMRSDLRAPHAAQDGGVRRSGGGAGHPGDHRRRRRRRAPAGHDRGAHDAARAGRARGKPGAPGAGLAFIHRSNAGGRSGGDACDRQGGSPERGAFGDRDPGDPGRASARAAQGLPFSANKSRLENKIKMTASRLILPGAPIGVLGGGQLGRMFAIAARRMGYRVHTFSPETDTPAGQVSDVEITGSFSDLAAVRAFARDVAVVTYEFENIPVEAVQAAAELVPVRPSETVLHTAQHRFREKSYLSNEG